MNTDTMHVTKKVRKLHGKSNKDHRLRTDKRDNFPNGYVEDWSSISSPYNDSEWGSKFTKPSDSDINQPLITDTSIKNNCHSKKKSNETKNNSVTSTTTESKFSEFIPVSMILSINDNLLLNKDNSYDIRFNTGMLEGHGIYINETGNIITFQDEGSYRFEISGEAVLFSDVDVKLIYFSDKFPDDIRSFSETRIPKDEGKLQLRGIPTILPLQKGQTIVTKLIPTPDESIILLAGTRLLIHRVA
jgi:hypothetical protein